MLPDEIVAGDARLREILSESVKEVDAREGSILILTADETALRFLVCDSPAAEQLIGTEQPLGKGVTGLACSLQQPMVVNDVAGEGEGAIFDDTVDKKLGARTESIMVVPLASPEREYGALTAINTVRKEGFTAADLERYLDAAEEITLRLEELEHEHGKLPGGDEGSFG